MEEKLNAILEEHEDAWLRGFNIDSNFDETTFMNGNSIEIIYECSLFDFLDDLNSGEKDAYDVLHAWNIDLEAVEDAVYNKKTKEIHVTYNGYHASSEFDNIQSEYPFFVIFEGYCTGTNVIGDGYIIKPSNILALIKIKDGDKDEISS